MIEPPLIRIKTLCSFLRTRERVSKTHKTSNFIYDFQSEEKHYKKLIYRQGKWLFPFPYLMWDLNSSMRKESQSKNKIQEIKENTIKNNLLHFLKWKITRIKILPSLLCSHQGLKVCSHSNASLIKSCKNTKSFRRSFSKTHVYNSSMNSFPNHFLLNFLYFKVACKFYMLTHFTKLPRYSHIAFHKSINPDSISH